ncbi:MAG: tRNA (adenosine(37)-N6)-threonylcarbamoyltransferase complex ATPase subunit type 1 TsaE [Acidimicrobiia bacterium]
MTAVGSLVTHAPEETRRIGGVLAALLEPGDVVLLAGTLGAGKTEFAKGIAEGLGIEETVVSPTFTIAREYEGRLRMLHVDVYRLDHAQELLDLGLEDLAADAGLSGLEAVTVVEWGDAVEALFPADHLLVALELGEAERARTLRFEASGPSWGERAATLAVVVGGAA